MHFVSSTTGWLILQKTGDTGSMVLFHTADAGATWQEQFSPDVPMLYIERVASVDDRRAYLLAGSRMAWKADNDRPRLFATEDGGAHWRYADPVPESSAQTYAEPAATFTSSGDGWLLTRPLMQGDKGPAVLYHTSDFGEHWEVLLTIPQGAVAGGLPCPGPWTTIAFQDARHGWLASGRAIYATSDGGRSWQGTSVARPKDTSSSFGFESLTFFSPTEGLAAAIDTPGPQPVSQNRYFLYLYETTDGGVTWKGPEALPGSPGEIHYSFPTPSDRFVASLRTLRAWRSGKWAEHKNVLPLNEQALGLQFLDGSYGWVWLGPEAETGLARTSDGGLHWTEVKLPTVQVSTPSK